MTDCRTVAAFLQSVAARSVTSTLPDADLSALQSSGLVTVRTPEEKAELEQEVAQLQAAQAAIEAEEAKRQTEAALVAADTGRTHSILFHLQGVDKEEAVVDRLNSEQEALQAIEADLARREADFHQLLLKRSELEVVSPYDGRFIAITTAGQVALRDLSVALYRVGDEQFTGYWTQARAIDVELDRLSVRAAEAHAALSGPLSEVDPTYLWAVAIGLAKGAAEVATSSEGFLTAYEMVEPLSDNTENRLLAAQVVAGLDGAFDSAVEELRTVFSEVEGLGVPPASAAGVAALLLAGRRADGTFATEPLSQFLRVTPSYESAALLAIVNRPYEELALSFTTLKQLFAGWGYSISEDTELASAYLTLSQLPADTVQTKMAILARGVSAYLQYPLVAAAVLASIPVLEANETLNLLEKAYEILGQRTGPMTQSELITLAVRLVHGTDVRSVNSLDPTQVAAPSYPSFAYSAAGARLWVPVVIVHANYFATFSAIGGAHPGHVHAVGGGFWGGGFGG